MTKILLFIGILAVVVTIIPIILLQQIDAFQAEDGRKVPISSPKAPLVISENNIYVTWWTNKTGNNEVLFRASTDGGQTFSDKFNLSNTTNAESVDAEIAAEGNNVIVTWWERNQTVNEPVVKISNDGGQTFGETLMLASNGTLSNNNEQ